MRPGKSTGNEWSRGPCPRLPSRRRRSSCSQEISPTCSKSEAEGSAPIIEAESCKPLPAGCPLPARRLAGQADAPLYGAGPHLLCRPARTTDFTRRAGGHPPRPCCKCGRTSMPAELANGARIHVRSKGQQQRLWTSRAKELGQPPHFPESGCRVTRGFISSASSMNVSTGPSTRHGSSKFPRFVHGRAWMASSMSRAVCYQTGGHLVTLTSCAVNLNLFSLNAKKRGAGGSSLFASFG